MKLVLLVAIFFSAKAFPFRVRHIEGIQGHIKSIDFDSNFNSYVVVYSNSTYNFYKIDADKNISLTQAFENIQNVIINSKNDVYLFERLLDDNRFSSNNEDVENDHSNEYTGEVWYQPQRQRSLERKLRMTTTQPSTTYSGNQVWIMREGVKKLTKLYYWEGGEPKIFLDKDDYLFVSTKNGLVLVKPGENVPLALTDPTTVKSFASDRNQNVYINTGENFVYNVPNSQKRSLIPSVDKFDFNQLVKYDILTSIEADYEGNIYYATVSRGPPARANLIIKDNNRGTKHLYSQFDTSFNFVYTTKNRLYITSANSKKYFSIVFVLRDLYRNYKIVAIEELFEYPLITNNRNLCANDSSGNVFFAHKEAILSIKHNETQVTRMTAPSMKTISSILVDKHDNLWVLAENLYFYKNGTMDAVWVANLPGKEDSPIKENKKTGEVYVGTGTGLSVIFNENQ